MRKTLGMRKSQEEKELERLEAANERDMRKKRERSTWKTSQTEKLRNSIFRKELLAYKKRRRVVGQLTKLSKFHYSGCEHYSSL